MNCQESQHLLSALYDGEPVPPEFAEHVDTCPDCRESLRAYSEIGAELRLLASRQSNVAIPPSSALYRTRPRFRLLAATGKIVVPRFAVAAAAILFFVMSIGLIRLRAQQSNPLWFRFSLSSQQGQGEGRPGPRLVAQSGYDKIMAGGYSPETFIGTHTLISAVRSDHVDLAIRARVYHKTNADTLPLETDLKDLSGHTFTYLPGQSLQIPVEGGGTLTLDGEVLDHKPRVMDFGIPLEPNEQELVMTNPVLISGNKVLANLKGMNTFQDQPNWAAVIYVPGVGLLKFALQSFPGSVPAEASWGNLDFKLDGQSYTLLSASQICGGDQPRKIWVSNNPNYSNDQAPGGLVSGDNLKDPHW